MAASHCSSTSLRVGGTKPAWAPALTELGRHGSSSWILNPGWELASWLIFGKSFNPSELFQ